MNFKTNTNIVTDERICFVPFFCFSLEKRSFLLIFRCSNELDTDRVTEQNSIKMLSSRCRVCATLDE